LQRDREMRQVRQSFIIVQPGKKDMQVVVDIPDQYFLDMTVGEFARCLKLHTALFMFQAGQLSAGAACEFADVDRYTFLAACSRHNIAVIHYDDELEAEFRQLKRIRVSC